MINKKTIPEGSIVWGFSYDPENDFSYMRNQKPVKGKIITIHVDGTQHTYFIPFKPGTLQLEMSQPRPIEECGIAITEAEAVSEFNQQVQDILQRKLKTLRLTVKEIADTGYNINSKDNILDKIDELSRIKSDFVFKPVNKLEIPIKDGVIRANIIPDEEYPGINLCYSKEGNGEPGVVLEYKKESDQVRLLVWDKNTVDDDPKYVLDLSDDSSSEVVTTITVIPLLVEMPAPTNNTNVNEQNRFVNELLKATFPNRTIILLAHDWNSVIDLEQVAWSIKPGVDKKIEYLELFKPSQSFVDLLKSLISDYHYTTTKISSPYYTIDDINNAGRISGIVTNNVERLYHRYCINKARLEVVLWSLYGYTRLYEVATHYITYLVQALYEPEKVDMELFLRSAVAEKEPVMSIKELNDEAEYIGKHANITNHIYGLPFPIYD